MRRRKRECAQSPRREAEALARQTAVDYVEEARQRGTPAAVAAELLNTPARTLRHWRRRGEPRGKRRGAPRGRPCKTASPEARADVRRFLREVSGPAVGLDALRVLFPAVPRAVLVDILRRYRRVWRRRYREKGFRLDWKRPGAVWAIDFSEPREPVDGVFDQLFAVRDLASHYQLAWMPATGAVTEQAIAAMDALFDEHGAPLLVKCDNGSAFISDAFRAFLDKRGVLLLYSPPHHPPYNGAIERANGVLKTYTQQHAAAEAHPFRWTSDDVEAARQLANTLSRPWGYRGVTPEEAWIARERIADEQRQAFQAAAERERELARKDLDLPPSGDLRREDQARLDRLALQRALCALDYLEMHRADRVKKAKRLSRAELAKRAAEDSGKPPVVAVVADAAVEAPVEAAADPAVESTEKPQAAAAPSSEASAADLATVEAPVTEPVTEPVAEPVDAPQATVESNNAPPHKAASGAAQENERYQLAPPMAADTMRAAADGDASVHSGASPPAPVDVEPAKPPWPLRFIAPLFARLKTAKIT